MAGHAFARRRHRFAKRGRRGNQKRPPKPVKAISSYSTGRFGKFFSRAVATIMLVLPGSDILTKMVKGLGLLFKTLQITASSTAGNGDPPVNPVAVGLNLIGVVKRLHFMLASSSVDFTKMGKAEKFVDNYY